MREIKFEYGFNSVNGIVKKIYYLHEIPNIKEKCDCWNILPIAYVRQYTGLKDKNGKEIYEGDIFYYKGEQMRFVDWNDDLCRFVLTNGIGNDTRNCIDLDCDVVFDISIIAQIYENPELLNNAL